MPTNEKEINNTLFDQLSLVERIERQLKVNNQHFRECQAAFGTLYY